MNLRIAKQIWSLMFPREAGAEGHSSLQFAVPHMFQPRLTLADAAFAVFAALIRMFSGALLFGVWGAYTIRFWQRFPWPVARLAIGVVSIAGFLASAVFLLISINLFLRKLRGPFKVRMVR